MKFDLRRKNLMKIMALTSMMVFSLFAAFSGAFAWFESVRNIDNDGTDFNVNGGVTSFASITFHQLVSKTRDAITGNATSFTFDSTSCGSITYDWSSKEASFSGDASISLGDYEPLDKEQPLLLVFHFNEVTDTSDGAVSISGVTDSAGFLGEKVSGSATPKFSLTDNSVIYKTVNSVNYYWMSSVVKFYNIVFPDDSLTYTYAIDSAYATAQSLPLLHDSGSRFVTANNEDDTCSFSSSATMYASSGESIKHIGIVIDYYPDAIEYIYSTYLGDTTLEDTYEGFLHFWCDWTMEIA